MDRPGSLAATTREIDADGPLPRTGRLPAIAPIHERVPVPDTMPGLHRDLAVYRATIAATGIDPSVVLRALGKELPVNTRAGYRGTTVEIHAAPPG